VRQRRPVALAAVAVLALTATLVRPATPAVAEQTVGAVDAVVALRVEDGLAVPGAGHVVEGWWQVPASTLAATRALLADDGRAVVEVAPVRVLQAVAEDPPAPPASPVEVVAGEPRSGLQWHLAAAEVPEAWVHGRGEGVVVAVLDSGITPGPDLACHGPMTEFDATGRTGPVEDVAGHGTHVAGTIAQCSDNGIGTAGVAPDATLLDVRVLGGDPTQPDSGNTADIATGLRWAVEQGADVVNLSLTGRCSDARPTWVEGCNDRVLDRAIALAVDADVVLVAAAGNDGSDHVGYPANHPDVLAVGAVDASRALAPYSSRGVGTSLLAPGGVEDDTDGDGIVDWVYQEGYEPETGEHALYGMTGTSMAAPHVAGVAALLRSAAPGASAAEVRLALLDGACPIGGVEEVDQGAGALRARNALRVLLGSDDPASCFRDVAPDGPFAAAVMALAAEGHVRGCGPTTFCPGTPVTRAQLARVFANVLGLPGSDANSFVDDDGSMFEADIEATNAAGITLGCESGDDGVRRYCPTVPVTRSQVAALLVRALGLPPATLDTFVDDDGSPFEADIEALVAAGVTVGCNPPVNDRYCGSDVVSRGELAALLLRGLAVEIPAPDPDPDTTDPDTTDPDAVEPDPAP
jgi:subtilisin family serine protease